MAMSLLSNLRSGVYLYDRRTGHERLVQAVERYGRLSSSASSIPKQVRLIGNPSQ